MGYRERRDNAEEAQELGAIIANRARRLCAGVDELHGHRGILRNSHVHIDQGVPKAKTGPISGNMDLNNKTSLPMKSSIHDPPQKFKLFTSLLFFLKFHFAPRKKNCEPHHGMNSGDARTIAEGN